nr:hypothetical protein [Halomonas socia]
MSHTDAQLRELILTLVPVDGSTIGNARLRNLMAAKLYAKVEEEEYERVRDTLLAEGVLGKGRGRGGSVYRLQEAEPEAEPSEDEHAPDLSLEMQEMPAGWA